MSDEGGVVLHCPGVATVRLNWWPTEISRSGLSRSWTEVERPGRRPLLLSPGLLLDEYAVGYLHRERDLSQPVADHVDALTSIARSKTPVELTMAKMARGLFHVTDLSLVEVDHATTGKPASVDVSLTLKRASDATVNVGPIPRKRNIRGGGTGFATGGSTVTGPRQIALKMLGNYGWSSAQFAALDNLWTRESNWSVTATNGSSGAYGIPQSLPGNKMASMGSDWRTNPVTQIKWGLSYIKDRYGSPNQAWAHFQSRGWY